jgi:aspartokinase
VPKACRINEISFEEMSIFAELGSRILHPNSVKLAQKYDVPLQVRPTFDDNDEGSIIDGKTSGREIIGLTYFQQSPQNITISLVGKTVQKSDSQKMIKILNSEKIFAEEIILLEGKMNASVTIGWVEQLERALVKLHQEFGLDAEGEQQAFVGIGKQVFDPAVK